MHDVKTLDLVCMPRHIDSSGRSDVEMSATQALGQQTSRRTYRHPMGRRARVMAHFWERWRHQYDSPGAVNRRAMWYPRLRGLYKNLSRLQRPTDVLPEAILA